MRSAERRKVNVLEMKCLTSLVGGSLMDRVRNEEMRRRAGIEMELASRAGQRVLRLFGHVKRMDEYRMARRVLMVKISEGRPMLLWSTEEELRWRLRDNWDRKEWRARVQM